MSWLKLKQGNWFVSIHVCLALCLLGSLLSCTSTKQTLDPSVYDNIRIEQEDNEGFMWIDWTKSDINNEPVKLNWKLTLDESSDYRSYKYFDNHFWLLDQQGSLFHIDVPTSDIEYYATDESWTYILTHDENNLLIAKESSNDISEIQLYQPKKRKVAWTKSLEHPTKFYLGKYIVNGVLYIGSASDTSFGSTVFAVRVKDGTELWRFNVQEEINSDLFLSNNRLFFTCKDSSCYALDQSNGKLLWRIHQDIYWRQDYTGRFKRFVSTNGILGYFGGTYQPLRLVEEETGTILWEYPYPATDIEPYIKTFLEGTEEEKIDFKWPKWRVQSIHDPAYAIQDTIALEISSGGTTLHVLNPFSRELLWKKEICHFCTPSQDENLLVGRYCLESDPIQFIIEKLEPQTGNVIWSTTGENLIENINVWEFRFYNAEVMGQYLLINDIFNDNLFLLDTKNGSRIWAYSSNSDKNYTLKQNNNKNIFFVEQHETNTILCFQVEEG